MHLHCGGAASLAAKCFLGLRQCTRLVELSLYGCTKLDDAFADTIGQCASLTTLNLSRTQAGTECCRAIGMLSSLRLLLLASCKQLQTAGLMLLAPLARLRALSVHSSPHVDDTAFGLYPSLHALEWLDLGSTKVGQATVNALAVSVPNLRGMGLSDTRVRESMLGPLNCRLDHGMALAFGNSPPLIATHPMSNCTEGGILREWLKT